MGLGVAKDKCLLPSTRKSTLHIDAFNILDIKRLAFTGCYQQAARSWQSVVGNQQPSNQLPAGLGLEVHQTDTYHIAAIKAHANADADVNANDASVSANANSNAGCRCMLLLMLLLLDGAIADRCCRRCGHHSHARHWLQQTITSGDHAVRKYRRRRRRREGGQL